MDSRDWEKRWDDLLAGCPDVTTPADAPDLTAAVLARTSGSACGRAGGLLAAFAAGVDRLKDAGHNIKIRHLSNTAAALLWPEQRFEMVRIGIGAYGHWPSKETQIAAVLTGRSSIGLYPALRWFITAAKRRMSLRSLNEVSASSTSASVQPMISACAAKGRTTTGRSSWTTEIVRDSRSLSRGAAISALRSGRSWSSTSDFASAAVEPVMSSLTPIL